MRPQIVTEGKIVSPQGAVPLDDCEIGRVRASSAQIFATRHPSLSEVFIAERFESASIVFGQRPFDQRDQHIDDRLGDQADDRRASEVLDGQKSATYDASNLRRVIGVPIRPAFVVRLDCDRFVDIGRHFGPANVQNEPRAAAP